MTTSTRPKAPRIRWTAAERQAVIDRAIELNRGAGKRSWTQLLNLAQEALPAERRRPAPIPFSRGPHGWFVAGVGGMAPAPEPPRGADPAPPIEPEPERPPPPVPPGRTPAEIAHAMAVPRAVPAPPPGGLPALLRAVADEWEFVRRSLDIHSEMLAQLSVDVDGLLLAIKSLHGELARRPQAAPAANGVVRPMAAAAAAAPPPPAPHRPRLPVIAVVGATHEQFDAVARKVGVKASLKFVERDHHLNAQTAPSVDGYVVTRHCSHSHFARAQIRVGKDRVIRSETTGAEALASAVDTLARRTTESPRP